MRRVLSVLLLLLVSGLAFAQVPRTGPGAQRPYYQGGPDVTVRDGGTGASTARDARHNLFVPAWNDTATISGCWTFLCPPGGIPSAFTFTPTVRMFNYDHNDTAMVYLYGSNAQAADYLSVFGPAVGDTTTRIKKFSIGALGRLYGSATDDSSLHFYPNSAATGTGNLGSFVFHSRNSSETISEDAMSMELSDGSVPFTMYTTGGLKLNDATTYVSPGGNPNFLDIDFRHSGASSNGSDVISVTNNSTSHDLFRVSAFANGFVHLSGGTFETRRSPSTSGPQGYFTTLVPQTTDGEAVLRIFNSDQDQIPLALRGDATQDSNLTEWQRDVGSSKYDLLSYIDKDGQFVGPVYATSFTGPSITANLSPTMRMFNYDHVDTAFVELYGADGQAGNYIAFKDSAGTDLAYLGAAGQYHFGPGTYTHAISATPGSGFTDRMIHVGGETSGNRGVVFGPTLTAAASGAAGFEVVPIAQPGGSATTLYGTVNRSSLANSANPVTNYYANFYRLDTTGGGSDYSGDITNAETVRLEPPTLSGSGGVTNINAIHVRDHSTSQKPTLVNGILVDAQNQSGGVATHYGGIVVGESANGSTGNSNLVLGQETVPNGDFSIYSASTKESFFNGPVTAQSLDLEGSTSGTLTQQAAATTTDYAVTWPDAQGGAGTVLTNDGAGALSWGAAGGSPSFNPLDVFDSDFVIHDDVDSTKKAKFQAATIATGQTRTYAFPNKDGGIVTTDAAQAFENKEVLPSGNNLLFPSDVQLFIADNIDTSKIALFEANQISTGTLRTYSFPDTNGTIVTTPVSEDINFNRYPARNFVFDNNTSLPTSPTSGQPFFYNPSGRSALALRDGSNWRYLTGTGTSTSLYVNDATGLDTNPGTSASPVKTIAAALNLVPNTTYGTTTINVAAGAYSGSWSIGGKRSADGSSIIIQGATSGGNTIPNVTTGGSAGVVSTGTLATIANTGASWTENAYRGAIILITGGSANNGQIRAVHDNTVDTITLCGTALPTAPVPTDTYTIYPASDATNLANATVVSGGFWSTKLGQDNVIIRDIRFDRGGSGTALNTSAKSTEVRRCVFVGATTGILTSVSQFSDVSVYDSVFEFTVSGATGVYVSQLGQATVYSSSLRYYSGSGTKRGVYSSRMSFAMIRDGTVIDMGSVSNSRGAESEGGSMLVLAGGFSNVMKPHIRNSAIGIRADLNGWVLGVGQADIGTGNTIPYQSTKIEIAGGIYSNLNGTVFGQTSTLTKTATGASTILGTGAGTTTFPAYGATVGKSIRITIFGDYSTGATPGNATLDIRLGSTTVLTTAALPLPANRTTPQLWRIDAMLTFRTIGGSATIIGQSSWSHDETGAAAGPNTEWAMLPPGGGGVATAITGGTTTNQVVDVRCNFDTSGNTIRSHVATIEVIN